MKTTTYLVSVGCTTTSRLPSPFMSTTATANAPCAELGATVPNASGAGLHVVGFPPPAVHWGSLAPPLPSPPGPPPPSPPSAPARGEQPTAAIATASDQATIPVC